MAISFPPSPTIGNTYTYGTTTWTFDGTSWVASALVGPPPSWTAIEIDFGASSKGKSFTITDAASLTTSKIAVVEDGRPATGRVGNDVEWDQLALAAVPADGTFVLSAIPYPGPIGGKRRVLYAIS